MSSLNESSLGKSIFAYLISPYKTYSTHEICLEFVAVFFGIVSVIFSNLANILVYPTGIVSTLLFVYLLLKWRLFGDMLINLYYTIMSVYGWILWANLEEENIKITHLQANEWQNVGVLFVATYLIVLVVYSIKPVLTHNFNLKYLKESSFRFHWIDYVDAFTSAVFLVGMFAMAEMKIEHWWFWIVGNFVSIIMYIIKKHAITALQFLIFLLLAVSGYYTWLQQM